MAVDVSTLGAELGAVAGDWRELDPVRDADLAVDGRVPSLWCEPASAEELAEVLRLASGRGAAVIPRGGGTRMALGAPPRSADILLSTRKLNQIVEYEPADLTVTAQAGLALDELQSRLGTEGQLLALDPPDGDRATLGGIVASNASGPLRLQYGSARDVVIGMRVANSDGVLTKAGGRVVKNVAGYDLNKLYTGSLGTLGVIVELSFKLHPLPQRQSAVVASFNRLGNAAPVIQQIMRSPLGPMSLALLDEPAAASLGAAPVASSGGGVLVVRIGGFDRAVARVAREIAERCDESGQAEIVTDADDVNGLWSEIRQLSSTADPGQVVTKAAVPPACSVDLAEALQREALAAELQLAIVAYAGSGLVYARCATTDDGEVARLVELVPRARALAVEREGSLVVEGCPPELKSRVNVWGEIGPTLRLMQALKEKLDPTATLNPGRFVGGI